MYRLFRSSKAARYAAVWAVVPPTWLADKVRGVDPPASLRVGLDWARDGKFPPEIEAALRTVRRAQRPEERL